MATKQLLKAKIGFTPAGQWDGDKTYDYLDVVHDGLGNVYVSKVSDNSYTLDTEYWEVMLTGANVNASLIDVVTHTAEDTEVTVGCNEEHQWAAEITGLTVAFTSPTDKEVAAEYRLNFCIGATLPDTIEFPSDLVWYDEPVWSINTYYEVSAKYNAALGIYTGIYAAFDYTIPSEEEDTTESTESTESVDETADEVIEDGGEVTEEEEPAEEDGESTEDDTDDTTDDVTPDVEDEVDEVEEDAEEPADKSNEEEESA